MYGQIYITQNCEINGIALRTYDTLPMTQRTCVQYA
jgi:hypothetical protein